jgi:hypothetical protein
MDEPTESRVADTEARLDRAGRRLAPSHALALRLASQGAGEREIARALDIPLEAVGPLLEVARATSARIARIGLVALFAALAPQLARAAVIEVTTLVDQDSGPACSLRNAILAANQNAPSGGCPAGDGDDRIELGGLTGLIELVAALPTIAGNGESTVIHGPGADRLTVSGIAAFVVFTTAEASSQDTTIEGLTIYRGYGTCVFAEGFLTLRECRITGCIGDGRGAAIDDGEFGNRVTVDRCLVDHNFGSPVISIGGYTGIGQLRMVNSTVSNNQGGIVFANVEGPGGLNRIWASTLVENGSANLDVGADQQVRIDHTILKQTPRRGFTPVDCVLNGTVFRPPGTPNLYSSASLASDASCGLAGPLDRENVDPRLDELADNGGPTATRALIPGSVAIDGGDTVCTGPDAALTVDQRGAGHPRPVPGVLGAAALCDIGAFEVPEPDPGLAAVAVVAGLTSISRRRRTHPGDTACGR